MGDVVLAVSQAEALSSGQPRYSLTFILLGTLSTCRIGAFADQLAKSPSVFLNR